MYSRVKARRTRSNHKTKQVEPTHGTKNAGILRTNKKTSEIITFEVTPDQQARLTRAAAATVSAAAATFKFSLSGVLSAVLSLLPFPAFHYFWARHRSGIRLTISPAHLALHLYRSRDRPRDHRPVPMPPLLLLLLLKAGCCRRRRT